MNGLGRSPWIFLACAGVLALAARWMVPTGREATADATREKRASTSSPAGQKHFVTPRQLLASNALANRSIGPVEGTGQDGVPRSWAELSEGRPVVLVFVKQGCPCNVEFEPFFRRVERLYRDQVRFAAVVDADVAGARAYADEMAVPYPVLADPDRSIIRRFGAENGGYCALLDPGGTIEGLWPGCSSEGLVELGRRIAKLSGVPERPLDTSGMPGPLTTGCPFGE
jgi:peroxiredoxin